VHAEVAKDLMGSIALAKEAVRKERKRSNARGESFYC